MNDHEAVARQLGREPRPFRVAARCPYGRPSVVENEKSCNMPTRFWLTCPHLDKAIARIEATGGVRAAQKELGTEPVQAIHEKHLEDYGVRVAGVRGGGYVKCLHAFTALHLSGAIPNPIGEWTLNQVKNPYPDKTCCTS